MEQLIDGFPRQLKEALEIGRKAQLKPPGGPYSNVVVTGLGGSGIGGRVAAQLVHKEAKCPIEVYNNYMPTMTKTSLTATLIPKATTPAELNKFSNMTEIIFHPVNIGDNYAGVYIWRMN